MTMQTSQPGTAALPAGIVKNPRLDRWLTLGPGACFTLHSGKVELGQGALIALSQIACDALGIDPDQLQIEGGNTATGPDEGQTAGSQTIDQGGSAVRQACLYAREVFGRQAAALLGVSLQQLDVRRGVFSHAASQRTCSYWSLSDAVDMAQPIGETTLRATRHWVGQKVPRPDLPQKLSAGGFIQDFECPGMRHARVIRGGTGQARIEAVDLLALQALPGVEQVLHSADFLALIGSDEALLVKSLDKARTLVRFAPLVLPVATSTEALMRSYGVPALPVHKQGQPTAATHTHQASYSRPFIAHASIGPACAVADYASSQLRVWSHTQGVYPLRTDLAKALGLPVESVQVVHLPGAGCYGHNGADDVAFDAAFIACQLGGAVRVQWMREDDMTAGPLGAPSLVEIDAGVDASGKICAWRLGVWSHSHLGRPGVAGIHLLGAWQVAGAAPQPAPVDLPLPAGGGLRNAVALYDFAHQEVAHGFVADAPLRTSALRSLGAFANVFAIESFMDEFAHKLDVDPLDFRLRHLADDRAVAVLEKLADVCHWRHQAPGDGVHGLGLGLARYKNTAGYCAVAARVRVETQVVVEQIWAVVDVGLVVNPDGLINQVEGGIVQSLSWTLKEQVTWDQQGITSRTWADYPILCFSKVPQIDVHVMDRPDCPSLGSGEIAAGPVPAAVANALARALGVRARHLPLTYERVSRLILESS